MSSNKKCSIFPFRSFVVLPAYGPNVARIIWSMDSPVYNSNSCEFQLQKSKDGLTDWFDLDMADPTTEGEKVTLDDQIFLDPKLGRYNQQVEWYYRAKIKEKRTGKVHITAPITYRHNLTDLEFGNIREILNLEYANPDGILMFLLRPSTHKADPMNLKDLSSSINPLTGQVMGSMVDNIGYGKTYGNDNPESTVKAFSKPIAVHLSIISNKYEQKDLETGHGSVDNIVTQFKSFAYPTFKRGDLIIDPVNDRRYLFDQVLQTDEFKGIIPLTFTGLMTQLSRNDPMYKYELPNCVIKHAVSYTGRT